MGFLTQRTRPAVEVGADQSVVRQAAEVLMPRWRLPEQVAVVALSDMASDLGVETADLAALVVKSSRLDLPSAGDPT